MEERDKNELVDLRTKISNEDRELGTAVIATSDVRKHKYDAVYRVTKAQNLPTIDKSAARSPVELEGTARVGHRGAVESEGLLGGLRGAELDEAIARITVISQ